MPECILGHNEMKELCYITCIGSEWAQTRQKPLMSSFCSVSCAKLRPLSLPRLRWPVHGSLRLDSHWPSHEKLLYLQLGEQLLSGCVAALRRRSADTASFTTRLMACSPLCSEDSWVNGAKHSSRFTEKKKGLIKMKEMFAGKQITSCNTHRQTYNKSGNSYLQQQSSIRTMKQTPNDLFLDTKLSGIAAK